jgi:hypothetical protein
MKVPKKKKWPKGLKARLARLKRVEARIAENKAIEKAIADARKKLK